MTRLTKILMVVVVGAVTFWMSPSALADRAAVPAVGSTPASVIRVDRDDHRGRSRGYRGYGGYRYYYNRYYTPYYYYNPYPYYYHPSPGFRFGFGW